MGIEYEIKFQATEQVQKEICAAFSGREKVYHMHTTYYDTPSGSLSERRFTLRRRMENEISVCTLKTPIGGNGRGEWEVNCQNIYDALPLLVELGAPAELLELTREGLQEVCGARFTRIAKILKEKDGILELALDRGVLTGGGKEIPLCEIEVELKEGAQTYADSFAKWLAQKYGLLPQPRSKFRRALDLSKGE